MSVCPVCGKEFPIDRKDLESLVLPRETVADNDTNSRGGDAPLRCPISQIRETQHPARDPSVNPWHYDGVQFPSCPKVECEEALT